MIKQFQGHRNCERGTSIAEFALYLPILFLLLAGILDLGTAFLRLNLLNHAVQGAARFLTKNATVEAGTGRYTVTEAQKDQAKNLIIYGQLTAQPQSTLPTVDAEDVIVTSQACEDQYHICVRVTYTHQFLGGFLNLFLSMFDEDFDDLHLSAATVI